MSHPIILQKTDKAREYMAAPSLPISASYSTRLWLWYPELDSLRNPIARGPRYRLAGLGYCACCAPLAGFRCVLAMAGID
ncbi:hypothetical protein MRX96_023648 [Rhipicephalus microplus]